MARALTHSLPSNTLEAAIRAHFGLAQAELARYLGVSASQVAHLEAGRRQPSPLTTQRLLRLARLLPPPDSTGPAPPDFTSPPPPTAPDATALLANLPELGVPVAGPLRKRQRQVNAQAAGLRWALHLQGKGEALQRRRQWGLTVLQAGLPGQPVDSAEQAHLARWLGVLAADVTAAAPGAAATTERALLLARLLALDVEAAALARLLA